MENSSCWQPEVDGAEGCEVFSSENNSCRAYQLQVLDRAHGQGGRIKNFPLAFLGLDQDVPIIPYGDFRKLVVRHYQEKI